MEEFELDEWFNEEKEKLEERFYAAAQKDVAKAKTRFDADYRKLIAEFQKRQTAAYESKLRAAKLRAPLARIHERYVRMAAAIAAWWTGRKLATKKWFFDRKVRRILKDKSDL